MNNDFYEFFSPVRIVAGLLTLVERTLLASDLVPGGVFDQVPPDSSLQSVRAVAAAYRAANCDALIAVGGGSVIDAAKAANILVSEGADDLRHHAGAHTLKRPLKPLLVVPATAGTGSEATIVAVVSDPEADRKLPFTSTFLLPNTAVLDPRMTLTLPAHITAMTAMDAQTHAIEACTGLSAKPISDAYATAAIRRISEHLLVVMDYPADAQGRLELLQASTMAGIAYSNSLVALVHALGHSLGAVCQLPRTLLETGKVGRDQLAAVAELAIDDASIVFNPVDASRADLLGVLEEAWQ